MLQRTIRQTINWGDQNKIAFAPEKLEMIHLSCRQAIYTPDLVVNENLTIRAISDTEDTGEQSALRWLGVWFDCKMTFKRHLAERENKAHRVTQYIRGLAKVKNGP
ncbi:hypothetical protein SBOR_6647 [Sclerotinia borealis F-4128]|uniref:Reverse transcriptase n=1 Tax=Sclerotinia borealis (strain F-4128) TaxID=1432307 RepID=W9CAW0_SCLBF|nr:hypothetical protein SBOR_6647 [Sclerotinia borealis F-4128]